MLYSCIYGQKRIEHKVPGKLGKAVIAKHKCNYLACRLSTHTHTLAHISALTPITGTAYDLHTQLGSELKFKIKTAEK